MGKLLIVNGSPRAEKSNSKKYAEIFQSFWPEKADTYSAVSQKSHALFSHIQQYEHLLFVFPLYTDAVPAVLLSFLKELETVPLTKSVKIHVIINCGFLEPKQNEVALSILRYFCKKNHLVFGMALGIATGEAILATPFAFLVRRKMKKFVKGILAGKSETLTTAMPLSKQLFLKASAQYWKNYGKQFHTSEEEMRSLKIEGE